MINAALHFTHFNLSPHLISSAHFVSPLFCLLSQVLKLTNMVTAAELNDDSEYFDIKEDVSTECSGYGQVLTVIIPRVKEGYPPSTEGFIFVEFQDASMARTCAIALSGRKFDARVVIVDYVSV